MNKITVHRKNYKSDKMYHDAIGKLINLLVNERYILTIELKDGVADSVEVTFDYADLGLCETYPKWMPAEEL